MCTCACLKAYCMHTATHRVYSNLWLAASGSNKVTLLLHDEYSVRHNTNTPLTENFYLYTWTENMSIYCACKAAFLLSPPVICVWVYVEFHIYSHLCFDGLSLHACALGVPRFAYLPAFVSKCLVGAFWRWMLAAKCYARLHQSEAENESRRKSLFPQTISQCGRGRGGRAEPEEFSSNPWLRLSIFLHELFCGCVCVCVCVFDAMCVVGTWHQECMKHD